ncbi:MAG TPA: DEAD/DEAH box helicase, partial [Saprospiraceae bacterium]|nr:DEAD/DEAH box helicase [Saprospiraceae bacterium]
GTPIENSLADLWAQMQFINPGMLGSAQSFKQAFRIPIERNQDEAKREELLRIVKPFILRRTKKSVTPELPELTEFVHYCEMDEQQAEIYEKEKSAVRNSILMAETDGSGKEKLRILNALQRLRQIASHPAMLPEFADVASGKFDEVSYFLENAVQCKEKVLVFSSYVRHLDKYCDWATSNKVAFSRLTGDVALAQRQREVENFQEKDIPWFFLSLKAGGTGLNLTAAELVFLIDPWWNPAAEQQAIARAHRIGQNRNVTAIRFITRNTIEEKILRLQQKKQKLASEIITEDEFFFSLDKSELAGLLE